MHVPQPAATRLRLLLMRTAHPARTGADPAPIYESLQTAQPLPRLGQPSEVADAVLACCAMTNVTGALLSVDGGYVAV